MNDTMQAQVIHEFGGASVMSWEQVPVPKPGPGEVRVKVHAAGINPVDWKTRSGGGIANKLIDPFPWIPGWDISGVVDDVGEGVTEFAVGDEAFGMVLFPETASAYAQYVVSPASHLVAKPTNISHAEAAGAPLAALTAWQGLFHILKIQPGERVLVHGASGGVGQFIVPLAARHGAHVIGTGSAGNLAAIAAAGAIETVDYRAEPFADGVGPVDKIFDAVGGPSAAALYPLLKKGGTLVSIAHGDDQALAEKHGVIARNFLVRVSHDQMAQIADLLADGTLKVRVSREFALEDAVAAHEFGESPGKAAGKIVLIPPGL